MKVRVLVVDDTDHVREMLASMLQLDGFNVVGTAASGAEAIELAEDVDPHVIVMDYKMPGMDGIKATRRIREILPSVPVILYTAYLDDMLTREAESAGVNVCIAKPDGIHTLERQISALSLELADVDIR